jgi:hypothetical protein
MFYATSLSLLFFANSPAFAQQGDLDIGSSDPLQESLDQSVEEMNNIYVVQPGDTLWSLSAAVLGDPESWPELWSINDYITNPHWIYPGNEVVFTLGTLLEPPKIDLETTERRGFQPTEVRIETTDVNCGPDVRFDFPQNTGIFTVPGFISDPEELFTVGKVSRARKNKVFLVEDDLVYLELDNPEDFSCQEKDVLTIFRRVKKRVPKADGWFSTYGSLYEIVGEIDVVHHYKNYVVGKIRSSYSEVQRGDFVSPYVPVIVQMEVAVPKGDLDGRIIEKLAQSKHLSTTRDTVFINRGSIDGVIEGQTFYVISQRDEFIDKEDNKDMPPSVVGRILVVRVEDDHSVAVITDASRLLEIGDQISMFVQ